MERHSKKRLWWAAEGHLQLPPRLSPLARGRLQHPGALCILKQHSRAMVAALSMFRLRSPRPCARHTLSYECHSMDPYETQSGIVPRAIQYDRFIFRARIRIFCAPLFLHWPSTVNLMGSAVSGVFLQTDSPSCTKLLPTLRRLCLNHPTPQSRSDDNWSPLITYLAHKMSGGQVISPRLCRERASIPREVENLVQELNFGFPRPWWGSEAMDDGPVSGGRYQWCRWGLVESAPT